jgi:hypothetical protein
MPNLSPVTRWVHVDTSGDAGGNRRNDRYSRTAGI